MDDRGLHSKYNALRIRCSYLISRLVKTHRKGLAPHVQELMSQFSDLLQLPLEPDLSVLEKDQILSSDGSSSYFGLLNNSKLVKSDHQPKLGITEQGFLYESIAQLISVGNESYLGHSVDHLFSALLNPILVQYSQLVSKFVNEQDSKLAKARGILIKQATDLIT